MKNVLRILVLLTFTASLNSCEKIKDLFNVDIDTALEGQMNLVSDDVALKSTEAYSINGSATIDLSDNDDLAEYTDLIEDIEVHSVTLEVVSIDSAGVMILAGSEFSISSTDNPGLTWPITSDWPIVAGTSVTLDSDDYSVLNDMLEGDAPVTFSSSGSCNKGNVHISLTYSIDVTVEANPT
jgi:hypothetical protein